MPDVIFFFRSVCTKLFGRKTPAPPGRFTALIFEQLRKYKDKIGDFLQPDVQEAVKITLPSQFWENYGTSVPELQQMAKRINLKNDKCKSSLLEKYMHRVRFTVSAISSGQLLGVDQLITNLSLSSLK